jgi:type I restriction enzyme S subunit
MTSLWPTTELGEIIDLFDSRRIPLSSRDRQQRQGQFPYYGAQGIIDHIDDFIFDGRYILVAEDGENLNSRKLPLALIAGGKFWVNNHAHILRAKPGVADDIFLLHCLNSIDINPYVTGAAQPKLSQANLRIIQLSLPPLPIQRRIAGILSAYDDLIENSQRRIKILEEMARRLYREWFVYFRFPGHENHPRIASPLGEIPEGWDVVKIRDIAEVLRGRSYRSVDLSDEAGLPFLNLKCLDRDGGFRRSGLKRYIGDFKESHIAKKGDIIMAVTDMTQERRIVARAALVPTLEGDTGVISMDLVRVEPIPGMSKLFLYSLFRYSSFADEVKHHANGANVLHLSPERVTGYELALPAGDLVGSYVSFVGPIYEEIDVLENRLDNLRRTRDLLLPRLLSGQIDIEALPDPAASEP